MWPNAEISSLAQSVQEDLNGKICVFDLVHMFSEDLSLHFYNQSEINSEYNTKWGCRNKIQYTHFKDQKFVLATVYHVFDLGEYFS